MTGRNAKVEHEKMKEYVEWDNFPYMKEINAEEKIVRYREITDEMNRLKAEKESLGPELEAALVVSGQKAVRCANLLLIECNGTTARTVSAAKLILAGVDPDIIVQCTEGGKKYTYVQVVTKDKR